MRHSGSLRDALALKTVIFERESNAWGALGRSGALWHWKRSLLKENLIHEALWVALGRSGHDYDWKRVSACARNADKQECGSAGCQPQSFTVCPTTWVWSSADFFYWYIDLCVFAMLSINFSNSKTFERRFILFENTFFYIWTTQEWMRLSWTLVRIRLRCDANHSLSLCARPGFDSALNLYIDTFIKICLQCFRSISRF